MHRLKNIGSAFVRGLKVVVNAPDSWHAQIDGVAQRYSTANQSKQSSFESVSKWIQAKQAVIYTRVRRNVSLATISTTASRISAKISATLSTLDALPLTTQASLDSFQVIIEHKKLQIASAVDAFAENAHQKSELIDSAIRDFLKKDFRFSLTPRISDTYSTYSQKLNYRHALFAVQVVFFGTLLTAAGVAAAQTQQATPVKKHLITKKLEINNEAPAASPEPSPINTNKALVGIYSDDPEIKNVEKLVGSKLDITAWFVHFDDQMQSKKLAYSCTNGYLPLITWESWRGGAGNPLDPAKSYDLAKIANGDYDSLITNNLRTIRQTCGDNRVIIRFDHEMDTPVGMAGWYPWQGNPATYIAAWRHIVTLSRTVSPNVEWLWSPNRGTSIAAQYYPGSDWVNYVGLTLNRGSLETQYTSFTQMYQSNQAIIESFNKPVIIAETTSQESFHDKVSWINGMFTYIRSNPNIKAFVWFSNSRDTDFNSTRASQKAFSDNLMALRASSDQ